MNTDSLEDKGYRMTATDELIAQFVNALENDIAILKEICTPDCRLWHSNDNIWMEQRPALDAFIEAQAAGMIPKFDEVRTFRTEKGFLARTSLTIEPVGKIHALQLLTVENDKITVIEEYVAPEIDIAAQIATA
ncbi:hypothetical protein AB0J48_07965 [Nocardia salmonicida]|uniref:hypothetical protein n=1 Tax=Nocardia salmonicida TaxID=53431 RepID=UPI003437523C